jgi:hypothetical protein
MFTGILIKKHCYMNVITLCHIMCSVHLEVLYNWWKRWHTNLELKLSVNIEALTYENYFGTSWKLLTTHNNIFWKCGILKQIIIDFICI